MNTMQMRAAVSDAYPGKAWSDKVAKMYDYQIIAIYKNLVRSGRLNQKPKKSSAAKEQVPVNPVKDGCQGVQLTIDDFVRTN